MANESEVTAAATAPFDPFAGPQLQAAVPSTEPQREIWTAAQLGPEASLAFNESVSLTLRGPLDIEALRTSLADLVRRHESLRATFTPDGLSFCALEDAVIPFRLVDASSRPDAEQERERRSILAHEVEAPFDLERGPLARVVALRFNAELHVVVITAHHIVVDGWSWSVLLADWAGLYAARRGGGRAELEPADRFSTYATEQAERRGSAEWRDTQAYWIKQFAGEIPVLDLPSDRPRPIVRTFAARRLDFTLPAELVSAVKRVGAASGASLFVTLLAAYKAWLFRLTGQRDVVVGVPAAGQAATGHEGLVGHCVQTLPLRSRVDPEQPFRELLRAVRGTVLDGFERQQLTYGELLRELPIRRDPSRPPLVSTFFNLDRALPPEALAFDGLRAELASNPRHFEAFDLFVNCVETPAGLVLECQYNTGLFDGGTIERFLGLYRELLSAIAADPAVAVGRLRLLSEADRSALRAWNDTARATSSTTVPELIEAQARRTPDAVAVVQGAHAVTYRELDERADQLAARLRSAGVRPGTFVGLMLERTPTLVAAVLGILKAGGAYVPLDPSHPDQRLEFMVGDCEMPVLVTQAALAGRLASAAARRLLIDDPAGNAPSALADGPRPGPEDTAYVIYTSGSTGKPKGVRVSHANACNLLESVRERPGMTHADVVLAITTLSFDISVSEVLLPLTVGARIVLVGRDDAVDGARLIQLLAQHAVTFVDATPATWRLLLDAGWPGSDRVKAICTGEAMPAHLAAELVTRVASLWNGYGPTETTVWASFHEVKPPVGRVVIGKPIANTQIHVVDARGELAPIGVPGEIWIGGSGVAQGYWKRPELDAERFIPDPWSDEPGARLYRTGDLGRWLGDGTVECLGRIDFQVKVRGYRIELGEIEAALVAHPAVAQAVAVAREDRPGDVRLVAYAVPRAGASWDEAALRTQLTGFLPEYMVPQHFVRLDALPLTPSGKIDRKALPAPVRDAPGESSYVAPATPTETLLAGLWEQALGMPRVGVHDDFFRLGGHSLLAAQLLSRLNREHGIALPFRTIFEAATPAKLAAVVDGRSQDEQQSAAARIPRRGEGQPAVVSVMQERILLLEELDPERRLVHAIPSAFRLEGSLDVDALAGALNDVVGRQESLRTTFGRQAGGYRLVVAPSLELTLERRDFARLAPAERDPAVESFLREEAQRPFDTERGPLFRAFLLRLSDAEHILFTLRHNAIWDGWSFDVFRHELAACYEARSGGSPASLPELPVSYADFAAWHRGWLASAEARRQLEFWRARLAGAPAPVELPGDRPRPPARSYGGGDEWTHIPRTEADALAELGRNVGATTFMVLIAAFAALLQRWTRQRDLLIAAPVRNRTRPEVEDLIGLFTNTLMLRYDVDPDEPFAELVKRVRATTLEAFSHQELPYDLLAREAPPVRVLFSLQEARHRETSLGSVRLSLPHVLPHAAAVDINLWLVEMQDGLTGALNYSTDLFDASTMRGFLGQYRSLLSAVARDPRLRVGRIPLVADSERAARARAADATGTPGASAPGDWLATSGSGTSAALRAESAGTLGFDELRREALARAAWLHGRGVAAGDLVGLGLTEAEHRLASLLGVLQLGAVPVPLDPREPSSRLQARLAAASAGWFWGSAELAGTGSIRALPAPPTPVAEDPGFVPSAERPGPAWVETLPSADGAFAALDVAAADVAPRLRTAGERLGLGPGSVLATLGEVAPFVGLLSLHAGACLASLADEEQAEDGASLEAWLGRVGATALVAPAFIWRRLLATAWAPDPAFVAVAAEPLPAGLAEGVLARGVRLFVAWGHEGAGGWWGLTPVTEPRRRSLVEALPGVALEVLEPSLEPAPAGVPGTLVFRAAGDDTWRPTGERARWSGGAIERLGRADARGRVRGRLVDLVEVRERLREHAAVVDTAAVLHDDARGDARLVAYLVPGPQQSATDTELRRHLRRSLEPEAIPAHFVRVPKLEWRADGTLETRGLPSPFRADASATRPPATPQEQLLVELWQAALGLPRVEVGDNFFDLGGHSLLCLELVAEVERRTGARLKPRGFLLGTLEQVAAELARTQAGGA